MSSSLLGTTTLCGSVPSLTKRIRTRVPAFADTRVGVNSSVLPAARMVIVVSAPPCIATEPP
jgi:hypothetical protein